MSLIGLHCNGFASGTLLAQGHWNPKIKSLWPMTSDLQGKAHLGHYSQWKAKGLFLSIHGSYYIYIWINRRGLRALLIHISMTFTTFSRSQGFKRVEKQMQTERFGPLGQCLYVGKFRNNRSLLSLGSLVTPDSKPCSHDVILKFWLLL